jgi:antitoxin VapB
MAARASAAKAKRRFRGQADCAARRLDPASRASLAEAGRDVHPLVQAQAGGAERCFGGESIARIGQLGYISLIQCKGAVMEHAKLFWSGRSQAVRLPKAYRFEGEEVRIRRVGDAVILEPLTSGWDWLDTVAGPVDADFAAAAGEESSEQERPGLDVFG